MVNLINSELNRDSFLDTLYNVSDGICINNDKNYIDFDKFVNYVYQKGIMKGDQGCSCDSLIINVEEKHIIYVEFKDMMTFETQEELSRWWAKKENNTYLKILESMATLGYFLKINNSACQDEYSSLKKSFFYVYRATTHKQRINTHIKNKFNRYNHLLTSIKTIETKTYERFLLDNNL